LIAYRKSVSCCLDKRQWEVMTQNGYGCWLLLSYSITQINYTTTSKLFASSSQGVLNKAHPTIKLGASCSLLGTLIMERKLSSRQRETSEDHMVITIIFVERTNTMCTWYCVTIY
jgi:hypothetical protein